MKRFSFFLCRRMIDYVLDSHRDLVVKRISQSFVSMSGGEINWTIQSLLDTEEASNNIHERILRRIGLLLFLLLGFIWILPSLYSYEQALYQKLRMKRIVFVGRMLGVTHQIVIPLLWVEAIESSVSSYSSDVLVSLTDYCFFWSNLQFQSRKRVLFGLIFGSIFRSFTEELEKRLIFRLLGLYSFIYILHSFPHQWNDLILVCHLFALFVLFRMSSLLETRRECIKNECKSP